MSVLCAKFIHSDESSIQIELNVSYSVCVLIEVRASRNWLSLGELKQGSR